MNRSTLRPAIALAPARSTPFSTLLGWVSLARQRSQIARLDDHMLRDIGITRTQADAEADRAFWDAPAHWHNRS